MATDITWPVSLQGMITTGNSRRTVPAHTMIQPRSGPAYVKYKSPDGPVFWDAELRFSQQDAAVFWLWFRKALRYGANTFILPVRTEAGLIDHEVMFLPDSIVSLSEGSGIFTYSATLMSRGLIARNVAYIEMYSDALMTATGGDVNVFSTAFHTAAAHPVSLFSNVFFFLTAKENTPPKYFDCLLNVGVDSTFSQYNYGYYTKYGIGSVSDISTNLYAPGCGSLATLAGYLHRDSGAERGILVSILDDAGNTLVLPPGDLTVTVENDVYECGVHDSISSSGNYVWKSDAAAELQQKWFTDGMAGEDIFVHLSFAPEERL